MYKISEETFQIVFMLKSRKLRNISVCCHVQNLRRNISVCCHVENSGKMETFYSHAENLKYFHRQINENHYYRCGTPR